MNGRIATTGRFEANVFYLDLTPQMIEAGVAVLIQEFGGSSANPGTDFERTAQAVFEAMLACCEPENLVYRPRSGDH